MKKTVLILAALVMLGACASNETADSSSVKQSEIYQDYSINWDSETKEWMAYATFRFGGENGTTLRLSKPSAVTINGTAMNEGELLFGGATYRMSGKEWPNTAAFRFIDCDGRAYANTLSFNAIDFARTEVNVSKNEVLGIPLTRNVLATDEIYLYVADTSQQNDLKIKLFTEDSAAPVKYDAAEQLLLIEPAFFEQMADVELSLWMKFSKTEDLKAATALGGQISMSYTSHTLKFKRGEAGNSEKPRSRHSK
jgi:hypothetical protein